jgi:hypothetical protein
MERGSDKHGFRQDEALARETEGLTRSGHDTHVEEWRESEPSGEDQPLVSPTPDGSDRPGTPEGMTPQDLDDRAALAALLGKEIWPAEGAVVQQRVAEGMAPDRLRDLVAGLRPDQVYENVAHVWTEVTGEPAEQRF